MRPSCTLLLCTFPFVCTLLGCGNIVVPLGAIPEPASTSLAGNWQIAVSAVGGAPPFSELYGAIDVVPGGDAQDEAITSVLLAPSTNCFGGTPIVPLHGALQGITLTLTSFSVTGQQVRVSAARNAAGDQLDGTFSVSGGCASNAAGKLTGVRLPRLAGTFQTSDSDGRTGMTLELQQSSQDQGAGAFPIQGAAQFTGLPCVGDGSLNSAEASISGIHVHLAFGAGNAGGAQLEIDADMDPAGKTLAVRQAQVHQGSCSSSVDVMSLRKVS